MIKDSNKHKKTFVYLGDLGQRLDEYSNSDPRFKNKSECARHLIEKGIKSDKKEREKALDAVKF